jgi:hypothetical protein
MELESDPLGKKPPPIQAGSCQASTEGLRKKQLTIVEFARELGRLVGAHLAASLPESKRSAFSNRPPSSDAR